MSPINQLGNTGLLGKMIINGSQANTSRRCVSYLIYSPLLPLGHWIELLLKLPLNIKPYWYSHTVYIWRPSIWYFAAIIQHIIQPFPFQFSSVQSLNHVRLFATPWTAARQASLSITNSRSPPKPMSIESVMPSKPHYPLSPPSPPALNLSQHQGLFKWVSSSHQVAKILEFQLQHQSFQWTPRTDLLYDGLVGSPCSPRDSQESSPTPQFKSINSWALSFLYSPTLTSIHDH